ncbi:MAG: VOC family protein [Paracoccaceae bacterium]|nr:MAG: VOC family protein [Paracoccaceae bacterium]
MAFVPLLQFDGTCADAMAFYARIFQAELSLTRYFEVSEGAGLPASDRVIQAELVLDGARLLGMDLPDGVPAMPQQGVVVTWRVPDAAAGQHLFDLLLDGGFAIMPYGPTVWAEGFGMLRDRFGTHWLISTPGGPGDL